MSDLKAVVVTSGGLDSTVALYCTIAQKYDVHAVSFNYGQRHNKELEYARRIADHLQIPHTIADITSITSLLKASVLTDHSREVPEGHYAESNMADTVVPNRNMIMASIAAGLAVSEKANALVMGVHAGDHYVYPDCRPEFINSLEDTIQVANEGFLPNNFEVQTPFLYNTKADIVKLGYELHVPFDQTWSCYKGGVLHCGRCGTCTERAEAFWLADVVDPTLYQDNEYWMTVSEAYALQGQ